MNQYYGEKKLLALLILIIATTLILTGTFAWSIQQFSITGGKDEEYQYLVKLLDKDSSERFVLKNWKTADVLDKKVYATSSYKDEDIAKEYDVIKTENPNALFSKAWVRIKLEEIFMYNGQTSKTTVKEILGDTLKSSVKDGKYFKFNTIGSTIIKPIDEWQGEQGRFWILDMDGWLYWAQPLLGTEYIDLVANPEAQDHIDRKTDHIIDSVSLKLQPSGVWEYEIKATLEAMDIELRDYQEGKIWDDVDSNDIIYELIKLPDEPGIPTNPGDRDAEGNLLINETNFPNLAFRTWIINNLSNESNEYLTEDELLEITELNISNQGIKDLTGIVYFTHLTKLDVSNNQLTYLNVKALTKLNKTDGESFKYSPQKIGLALLRITKDEESIKEWEIDSSRYDEEGNVLINLINFPDQALVDHLLSDTTISQPNPIYNDMGKMGMDGTFSPDDISKITMMYVSNTEIVNLSGLEHFPKLEKLYAQTMPYLSSVDVSNNPNLKILNVYGSTKLITLDVSNNLALEQLFVYNCSLTSLTLGNKSKLNHLRVQGNKLSSLDISGTTATLRTWLETNKSGYVNPQSSTKYVTATITASTTTLTWK